MDVRAAARLAAQVRGVTLGEWFDDALRMRAGLLGVTAAELGADQRVDAIMARLRVATNPLLDGDARGKPRAGETADTSQNAEVQPDADRGGTERGREPMMHATARRLERDDDAREAEVTIPSAPSRSPDGHAAFEDPAFNQQQDAKGARQAAQRVDIETKLQALFKALDRTPRRSALDDVEADLDPTPRDRLLGETAISASWRLDKAVAEIAERQAFLERQTAGAGAAPARPLGAVRPESPGSVEGLRFTSGAAGAGGPSAFAALQGDMTRLAGALDAVERGGLRHPASPGMVAQDGSQERLSLETLHRSVEQLTARLDAHGAPDGQSAAIEKLSRRIEEVHAEVTGQLAVARPAFDTGEVERLVAEVVARNPARTTGTELAGLEAAVQDLAGKLAAVERTDDGAILAEMQTQVTRLAERMDRTDAGLTAIVAVERSLGDIVSQVGDMKMVAIAAAETAARSAAEETLRSVLPHIAGDGPEAGPGQTIQLSAGLAQMRAEREKADERLHAILAALNTSLERVVNRLEVLEHGGDATASAFDAGVSERPSVHQATASQRPAAGAGDDADPLVDLPPSPLTWSTSPQSPAFSQVEPVDLDLPLEPGSTPGTVGNAAPAAAVTPDPTSFIAAARRAAQSAAQEQASRLVIDASPRRASPATEASTGQNGLSLLRRRRPLLLALAGLLLLAGAAQIARMSLADPGTAEDTTGSIPTATTPAAPAKAGDDPVSAPDKTSSAEPTASVATEARADVGVPAAMSAPASVQAQANTQVLPTMAMGPLASVAALKAADASARLSAAPGIPAGLQQLAEDGRPDAQFEVGMRYAEGRRVARNMTVASGWFEKAASQGLAPAAYRLGSLYEKGVGVARDPGQAIAWYRKAADAGSIRAMHNLAVMLAEGAGAKADYPQAVGWFTKAAEAGVRDSQYNLAILYARGLGVTQDLGQSYKWFSTAALAGDADSAKKRDEVASRMDPATLAAAKIAVDTFKPVASVTAANEVQPPPGGWDAVPTRAPAAVSTPGNAHVSRL